MKKKRIKGFSAFALLDGLDDDMILDASLPEALPDVAGAPAKDKKRSPFFARKGWMGLAAAVVISVVSLTVLAGVVTAGVIVAKNVFPSDTPGISDTQDILADGSGNSNGGSNSPLDAPEESTPVDSQLAVMSDGFTVYPKGYCVYISGQQIGPTGELNGFDGDGPGAVNQLAEIWDELPTLRTAGNSYELNLPEHMTLRGVRAFAKTDGENMFSPLELVFSVDPMQDLTSFEKGEYVVVLEIYHETIYSADEYVKGMDEYAFRLTVDASLPENIPLTVFSDGSSVYPKGYQTGRTYLEVTEDGPQPIMFEAGDGVADRLEQEHENLPVLRTNGHSFTLAVPQNCIVNSIEIYNSKFQKESQVLEAKSLSELGAGTYYIILKAGETEWQSEAVYASIAMEYAFCLEIVMAETYVCTVTVAEDLYPVGHHNLVFFLKAGETDAFIGNRGLYVSVYRIDDETFTKIDVTYPELDFYAEPNKPGGFTVAGGEISVVCDQPGRYALVAANGYSWPDGEAPEDALFDSPYCVFDVYDPTNEPPASGLLDIVDDDTIACPKSIEISVREWTGSRFDGYTSMLKPISSFADEMPTVLLTPQTKFRVSSEVTLDSVEIFDMQANSIMTGDVQAGAPLFDVNLLLMELPSGTYYLVLKTVKYGRYIESMHLYEEWVTNHYVILIIP